jgi:signal transduction histidine kinase
VKSSLNDNQLLPVDSQRLQQVIINLVSNAIKFSKAKSTIHIELLCNTENLVVRVKDQGIGISQENVERIFEPYFRVTDSKSLRCNPNGNGLGLSICKQICTSLGGYLQCFSEVNVGTCMVFAMKVNDGDKLQP